MLSNRITKVNLIYFRDTNSVETKSEVDLYVTMSLKCTINLWVYCTIKPCSKNLCLGMITLRVVVKSILSVSSSD